MLASTDRRTFSAPEERYQRCMFCGRDLVVLPNDRRGGACFDCLVLTPVPGFSCPECGAELPDESWETGCRRCGWSARIDGTLPVRSR